MDKRIIFCLLCIYLFAIPGLLTSEIKTGEVYFESHDFTVKVDKKDKIKLKALCKKYLPCKTCNFYVNPYDEYHVVTDAFYIDKFPVSIKEYLSYANEKKINLPKAAEKLITEKGQEAMEYPVTGVTWHEASDYCKENNKRLPHADEYNVSAYKGELLPWDTYEDINVCLAPKSEWKKVKSDEDSDKYLTDCQIKPIGYSEKDKGNNDVYDIYANIQEWTSDNNSKSYFAKQFKLYEEYSDTGEVDRIIKKANAKNSPDDLFIFLEATSPPDEAHYLRGFRCSRDAGGR